MGNIKMEFMLINQVWKLVGEHRYMDVTSIKVSLDHPGPCRGQQLKTDSILSLYLSVTSISARVF